MLVDEAYQKVGHLILLQIFINILISLDCKWACRKTVLHVLGPLFPLQRDEHVVCGAEV